MQHDSVIWKVISPGNGGFCSFRRTMPNCPTKFCKNAYNVLGICHPLACPLANSRYATIREHKGQCYLLIKTIERAHSPSKHWEKIKLSKDYITALKQIDEYLMWWPKWNIHKCKLRLTKMHQYLIRARKIALSVQPKMLRIWKPYERQQVKRERKAEMAAKITNVIKSELLERLHEGVYEGIYNFPMKQYNEILDDKGKMDESETESESETENEKSKDKEKSKNKKEKQKSKKDKNKDSKEKEKEKESEKEIENEKGDMFVADYGDDSDFEFVESGEESDYDIEDLEDEKEKEMELEYEYEMENGFNGQAPSNINDMNNMGQSIKSIAPSVKKNDQNNKNNNKKNRSKSRNRKNNNDNNSSRNNNDSNNNDNGNGNWMNKQNNNRSRKQQWSRNNRGNNNNNSNNNNNTSILGKRGNGKFRNNTNNNKSNKGKGNNNNFDDFGMGSAMKAPPKKRQRKVKIGYD